MLIKYKCIYLFIVVLSFSASVSGQTTYNAMLLSLKGEGIFIRNTEEHTIEVPQRFMPGDELSIKKGDALIMLFSGKEVPLSAVSFYTVPAEENTSDSQISQLANKSNADQSLLAQAGVAFRIRGKSNVFPRNSKILIKENANLQIGYKDPAELKLALELIDSKTQKVILSLEAITASIVSLEEAPFIEGRSYYWTLSNTPDGRPELGTIIVPKKDDPGIPVIGDSLKTHFDYMDAISALYDGGYLFDVYVLINEAREKYPEVEGYELLLEKILTE